MKTLFNGFKITMLADDPAVRRVDRQALKSAGLFDQLFDNQLAAQLELHMSDLDESRFYVAKTYAVTGLL